MSVNLYYFSTAESQRHKQSLSVDAASNKWRSGLSANGKYMGNQWEIAAKLSLSLWLIESIVPGVKIGTWSISHFFLSRGLGRQNHWNGFRDRKYFKLNIYPLPEISSVKELQFMAKAVKEALIMSNSAEWWVMRDSNSRHSRCKRDALTNWANHPGKKWWA